MVLTEIWQVKRAFYLMLEDADTGIVLHCQRIDEEKAVKLVTLGLRLNVDDGATLENI